MIENNEVLYEEYIPRRMPCRNQELNWLSAGLKPVAEGNAGADSLVIGPRGTGKSCAVRYLLRELHQHTTVNTAFLQCWGRDEYSVLAAIARKLQVGTPGDVEDASRYLSLLSELPEQAVIVLDEADSLKHPEALCDLLDLRTVTVVGIANRRLGLTNGIDYTEPIASARSIKFSAYTERELVEILQGRVSAGFANSIDTTVLQAIARAADGDARRGLAILRTASRRVSMNGGHRMTTDAIDTNTIREATRVVRKLTREELTGEQRLIYSIVNEDEDGVLKGELYPRYRTEVSDPVSESRFRTYLAKLVRYDLIAQNPTTNGVRFVCKPTAS